MIPEIWHIYTVNLEPRVGTKPGKQRPCLVIQPTEFSEAGLESSVIIPLTTNITKGAVFPLRVRVQKGVCDLKKESDLLVDQILAWDNSLFVKDLGEVPDLLKEEVRLAIKDFLDL